MKNLGHIRVALGISLLLAWFAAACSQTVTPASTPTATTPLRATDSPDREQVEIQRDSDVPTLPFPDNPDPDQCGIPQQWGQDDPAWLSGYYEGELIQSTVLLYDSHLRKSIIGAAPTGSKVEVILYQSNPVLDYYLVRTLETEEPQEGWVPAPFLSFEPIENAS